MFRPFDLKSIRYVFVFRTINIKEIVWRIFNLGKVYWLVVTGKTRHVTLKPLNSESKILNIISQKHETPKEIEIISVFWGLKFSEMFSKITLFSVLQSVICSEDSNFPVILKIFCPLEDWIKIKNDVEAVVFQFGVNYEWNTFDKVDCDVDNKNKIAQILKDEVKIAEIFDRILIFSFPDFFFGRGLDQVIKLMQRGDYVVCPQVRIDEVKSPNALKKLIFANKYSNRDLVKYQ